MSTQIETPKIPGRPQSLRNKLAKAESTLSDAEAALATAQARLEAASEAERSAATAAACVERNRQLGAAPLKGANEVLTKLRKARANRADAASVVEAAEQHRDQCSAALEAARNEVARSDLARLRKFIADGPTNLEPVFGAAARIGAELVTLRHALANYMQALSDARTEAERAAGVLGERAGVSVPYLSALCIEFAGALRRGATEQILKTPSVHTSSASELDGMLSIAQVTERVLPPAA